MKVYIKSNYENESVLQTVKNLLESTGYKENKGEPGTYLLGNGYLLCVEANQISDSGKYYDVGLSVYDGSEHFTYGYVGGITIVDIDESGDFGSIYAFVYNESKETLHRMYDDIYDDEYFDTIDDAVNYVISYWESLER